VNADQAYSYIERSVAAQRLAQAYVVVAPPRGVGDALAIRVLMLLNCTEKDAPCGCCRACLSVQDRTHPDVHWIEPQMKSRVISVKQMRGIQKQIYETSFSGGWKACVIIGADCLNPSAANAFLKTLEEPPEKTLFLLLTDSPQRLLPTIISRCHRMTVTGGDGDGLDDDLRTAVTDILASRTGGGGIQRLAKGDRLATLLKAVKKRISDEENAALDDEEANVDSDTLAARVSSRYLEVREAIMRSILLWYRDILLLCCDADPTWIHHGVSTEQLEASAAGITYRNAAAQVRAVEQMNRQLGMNMPEPLVFTVGFSVLD
jgi:DNA polymerase III subunit delta'